MLRCKLRLFILAVSTLLTLLPYAVVDSAEAASTFGNIFIPSPEKPNNASQCVEATDVMRRDHMKFLLHQRDKTVFEGVRSNKHSLVGCINCHNPAGQAQEVLRYENPRHFCAGCHLYASVKIDCFECHADRGLESVEQSRLLYKLDKSADSSDWQLSSKQLSAKTLIDRIEDTERAN